MSSLLCSKYEWSSIGKQLRQRGLVVVVYKAL